MDRVNFDTVVPPARTLTHLVWGPGWDWSPGSEASSYVTGGDKSGDGVSGLPKTGSGGWWQRGADERQMVLYNRQTERLKSFI